MAGKGILWEQQRTSGIKIGCSFVAAGHASVRTRRRCISSALVTAAHAAGAGLDVLDGHPASVVKGRCAVPGAG